MNILEAKMTNRERVDIENALYAVLCPVLAKYEVRGYNSHTRAQLICQDVIKQANAWILLNHPDGLSGYAKEASNA